MKVRELIEELEKYDGDREAYVLGIGHDAEPIARVNERHKGIALRKNDDIEGDNILLVH